MSNFLDIPREIRDTIYEIVLGEGHPLPLDADVYKTNRVKNVDEYRGDRFNRLPFNNTPVSGLGLLLTNRQICSETQEAVKRYARAQQLCLRLDIILKTEGLLYPTWTHIPFFSWNIHRLEVNFRIAGHNNMRYFFMGSTLLALALFALTDRFLRYGPTFMSSQKNFQGVIHIKTLFINVVTINPPPFVSVPERIHQEFLNFMLHRTKMVLNTGGRFGRYRTLMMQRIDKIVFALGGIVVEEINVHYLAVKHGVLQVVPPKKSASLGMWTRAKIDKIYGTGC
jgi:hypothetical protein